MTRRTPRKGRLRPGNVQLLQSVGVSFAAIAGFVPFATNTTTMVKISAHVLSVDPRLLESRITIANVRIDHRRTFRAVGLCARATCQHFCTDGREEIAQWLRNGFQKWSPLVA